MWGSTAWRHNPSGDHHSAQPRGNVPVGRGGDRLQYSVRHSAMAELAISPASSALHPVLLREGIVGRQKNKAIAFFDE